MNFTDFLQALINGLLLGGVYAGLGIGLSLLLGVLRVVNLAHSAVLVFSALLYWQFTNGWGLDPFLAILPVLAISYVAGLGIQRGIAQFLTKESDTTVILAFFGLMIIIETVAILIWTIDPKSVQLGYLSEIIRIEGINIPVSKVAAAGLTVIVLIALHLFLTRTLTGSAIRGLAQNRDVAEMVGINVNRLTMHVFALGIAFSAFGGVVLSFISAISPNEHTRWLAWAFLVVILGGLGSVLRTLVAGLVVGLFETFVGLLIPFQYTYLALYALLAGVLLLRSEGLSGVKQRTI